MTRSLMRTTALLAGALALGTLAADARPGVAPARVGSIEGVVTFEARPARRTLDRYSSTGVAARTLQAVPAVAYLEGRMTGVSGASGRMEVAQVDTAFAPALLVVPAGATVAFPNRDPFFHNVFSYSPAKRFDLGRYPRGESKSVEFDRAGIAKVYCEVHEFMRSAVVVVENPYYAVVGAGGRFTIRNVPAGRHRLVVWDIERRPHEMDVTVTDGGVARVQVTLK